MRSLPDFPGSFAFSPHFVEQVGFSESIHWLPKTIMFVGHTFTFAGEGAHWCVLKHHLVTVVQVIENLRGGDAESAADPTTGGLWLFVEFMDLSVVAHP